MYPTGNMRILELICAYVWECTGKWWHVYVHIYDVPTLFTIRELTLPLTMCCFGHLPCQWAGHGTCATFCSLRSACLQHSGASWCSPLAPRGCPKWSAPPLPPWTPRGGSWWCVQRPGQCPAWGTAGWGSSAGLWCCRSGPPLGRGSQPHHVRQQRNANVWYSS